MDRSTVPDPPPPPSAEAGSAAEIARLAAELVELRQRMDIYERLLQIRDAVHPTAPASDGPSHPLPPRFDITADQLLPTHDGFYQLEWGPEGAFRWTGPDADVHFEAWLDRSQPLFATLRIFHFGTPANARELILEVDGIVHALTRQNTEKVLLSDPIAPRPGSGPTRLTLKVPHIHSPAARGATDKRILGVAFQRLLVERA
jgi:hypothetical protein